uniref:Uncharacterized protein n=1 Tax=Peronospora matthiolae TaxID=2874970 RepID=A0AAV1UBZ8_9STRA
MVRVPGSSEASGFHRESTGEDVKIKQEPGIEVSATEGSTQTRRSTRSSDHQSVGRCSDEMKMKEEDREIGLEDKPQFPPRVLPEATADRSGKSDLLDENPKVKTKLAKAKPYALVDRSPDLKPRSTIARSTTSERSTTRSMGSDVKDRQIGRTVQPKIGDKANTPEDKIGTPSGSFRNASDDSESESDGSISIRRISLGPWGGTFIKDKIGQAKTDAYKGQAKSNMPQRSAGTHTGMDDQEEGDLSRYFNSAMKKYEADQRTAQRIDRQPSRHPDRRTLLQPSH